METLDNYNIDLRNLRAETQEYSYTLKKEYFEAIKSDLVKSGNVDAQLLINKKQTQYTLTFTLKGIVQVPCDRCLDDMDITIDTVHNLTVKLGSNYQDTGDDITIPDTNPVLNVAWTMYEFIALEIPTAHMHPAGQCNEEMTKKLSSLLITDREDNNKVADRQQQETQESIDPRWEKLKQINKQN